MKRIEKLKDNQVFVFGSNVLGHHIGGAARQALDDFGACWLDTNVENVHGIGFSDKTYPVPQEEQLKRFLAENEISNTPIIDCSDNEAVFLALAALRDDTDKDQWFTNGTDWAIWREEGFFRGKPITGLEFHYLPSSIDYDSYHKATADEIIEHFTMEESS